VMVKRLEIQLAHKLAAVSVVTNRGGEPAAGSAPGASREPNANDRLRTQMQRRLDAEITQVRSTCNALNAAALKLQELQENFVKQAEEQLLELAIEIAGKVLVQEIRAERPERTSLSIFIRTTWPDASWRNRKTARTRRRVSVSSPIPACSGLNAS